ncbi:MAG TPA: HAD family hydrolase [Steroidobacteraceae bacterium]|jgi:putative hydrolase of the HAD superfamily|nr:HAD family hydrolase [Steroidobacteraceae bacterium]
MPTIRILSLDLDDTLWPVAPVIAAAEIALLDWLKQRYPEAARGHDVDSMRALRVNAAAQFPERSHDLTFLRRRALAVQFAAAGHAESLCEEALEIFLAARNRVELYADVRPALERLRARYRLFAVSNGNADLDRCGLGELFDGHITAIAAGAAKPDARIFAALRSMAGVHAAEVMHVGDDPVADVQGASEAGMHAVWLNRGGLRQWPAALAAPPRTISTLAEIA